MGAPPDKYQLIASLGRGGMADVYLAGMHGPVGFHKLVVVKRLRDDVADKASFTHMLLEEAQLAARLQHPNVVQTFEVGIHEDRHYIVMEYLQGQPIARILKVGGRPDPGFSARVMGEALAGLEYAHTLADYDGRPLQIVHRDVSPQNLFITYDGEVKVVDFGVAKTNLHVGDQTEAGVIKGKLGYMAPEQLKGGTVDRRTDVFAAGIVFWEMLTGRRLFARAPDEGPTQAIAKILFQSIPPPSELEKDVPPALEAVCMRALERDVDRRWQSAGEMREALYQYRESTNGAVRRDDVGKYVLSLFEEERAAIRAQITEFMTEASQNPLPRGTSSLRVLHVAGAAGGPESRSLATQARTGEGAGSNRELETMIAGKGASRPPAPPESKVSRSAETGFDHTRMIGGTTPASPSHPVPLPAAGVSAVVNAVNVMPGASVPPLPPGMRPGGSLPPLPPYAHGPTVPVPRPTRPRTPWGPIAAGVLLFAALVGGGGAFLLRTKPKLTTVDGGDLAGTPLLSGEPELTLEGSGTIGVEAVPAIVEAFFKKRGATAVRREKGSKPDDIRVLATTPKGLEVILIRNEGTNGGFQCLADKTCDIAMAAREIRDTEAQQLLDKGVGDLRSAANEHVVALDGIAVIVNRSNEVKSLDRAQIDGIFTGRISDWSAVGGSPGAISLVVHENGAGTLDAFDAMVLGGHALAAGARRLPDNAAIADAVGVDQNATGFVGLSWVRTTRAISVSDRGVAAMFPSAFTVTTEKYLLSRRFYLYTPAPPKQLALEFVDFALSEPGQHAVRDAGLVDLEIQLKNAEPCDRCPAKYAAATKHARRLSLDFRFRPGTRQLDARATRDVDRVVRFLRDHASAKVMLFGFSDRTGDAKAEKKASRELAQAVNAELGARGVRAGQVEGYGAELSVATSATEWGRTKNRRVEIWVEEDK